MQPDMTFLDEARFQSLLAALGMTEAVHDYHTLSGLLLAVASAPTVIPPSEWMALVYVEEEPPPFPDKADVSAFIGHLLGQWNYWVELLGEDDEILPLPAEYQVVEGMPTSAFSSFCQGIAMGYGWLEELWLDLLDPLAQSDPENELSSIFGTVLVSAMVISDPGLSNKVAEETPPDEDDEAFPDPVEAAGLLPIGLKILGRIGMDAAQFQDENVDSEAPYINPDRLVGRNDPCPCGSGKKYKKCCLS